MTEFPIRCGYKWYPPKLFPPGPNGGEPYEGFGPEQTCYLKIGHTGDHRSLSKVTASNRDDRKVRSGR